MNVNACEQFINTIQKLRVYPVRIHPAQLDCALKMRSGPKSFWIRKTCAFCKTRMNEQASYICKRDRWESAHCCRQIIAHNIIVTYCLRATRFSHSPQAPLEIRFSRRKRNGQEWYTCARWALILVGKRSIHSKDVLIACWGRLTSQSCVFFMDVLYWIGWVWCERHIYSYVEFSIEEWRIYGKILHCLLNWKF